MKNIKLVGLDLDGTLLNEEKRVTEYSREVLNKVIALGVIVSPATGRPITGIPRGVLEFPGIRYALTANGARITDIRKDRTLYEALMPVETARRVLEVLEPFDAIKEIYFDGVGYAEEAMLKMVAEYETRPNMAEYIAATRVAVKSIHKKLKDMNRPLDKVQAFFRCTKDRDRVWEELRQVPCIEITGAGDKNIEVSLLGVNKGTGLIKLGKILGITREEIMAVGDGHNDTDMIREAGLGVAMGNGADALKAQADYITESNEEDGAAKALERFVLERD